MHFIKRQRPEVIIFLIMFLFTVFISVNRSKNRELYSWENMLWADQAGYYVYNPAFFLYHFDGNKMPAHIASKTGNGFEIDSVNHKISTKYNYGVALMQSPFFLASRLFTSIIQQPDDGFSKITVFFILIAGAFYMLAGLFFLYLFLCNYFKSRVAGIAVLLIFSGTNLWYYTINSPGMSHVYSFFLFSAFLFYFRKLLLKEKIGTKNIFILSLLYAMIILIRPTNAVILLLVFFFDLKNTKGLKARLNTFFKPWFSLIWILNLLLLFLPQLIYWYYLNGKIFYYSYTHEGFSNIFHPHILSVLLAPMNGLIPYNPIVLFILTGMLFLLFRKNSNGWLYTLFFVVVLYITASWHDSSFGCSFGARNFTEYFALFVVPLAFLVELIFRIKKDFFRLSICCLLILSVYINQKLTSSFNNCFFGSEWDFNEYFYLVKNIKNSYKISYRDPGLIKKDLYFAGCLYKRSGKMTIHQKSENEFYNLYRKKQSEIGYVNFRKATVKIKVQFTSDPGETLLVISIDSCGKNKYWNACSLKNFIQPGKDWPEVKFTSFLPLHSPLNDEITIYTWNKDKKEFYLNDIRILLE